MLTSHCAFPIGIPKHKTSRVSCLTYYFLIQNYVALVGALSGQSFIK